VQNEREIETLKGVIERLKQSLEDLAAAAQVSACGLAPLCSVFMSRCAGAESTAIGSE
jgi:hypothetical protein